MFYASLSSVISPAFHRLRPERNSATYIYLFSCLKEVESPFICESTSLQSLLCHSSSFPPAGWIAAIWEILGIMEMDKNHEGWKDSYQRPNSSSATSVLLSPCMFVGIHVEKDVVGYESSCDIFSHRLMVWGRSRDTLVDVSFLSELKEIE